MKSALIICAAIVGIFAIPVTYSTLKGYTRWYWRAPQTQVFVNGKSVPGYVHQSGQVFFITRRDTPRPHSHEIVLRDQSPGFLLDCGQWVAPRSFVFALGHVNPPCLSTIGAEPADATAEAPVGPFQHDGNSFEFRTRDGKLIRVLLAQLH
jgi:hypothetical protein